MSANTCFPLPEVKIEDAKHLKTPSLKIRSEEDVDVWKSTKGYHNYLLFLHRLSESVVGYNLYEGVEEQDRASVAVRSMLDLLDKLDRWIDEVPPLETPQRFGNLAFRSWGKKLEDNAVDLMKSLLPVHLHGCIRLLVPYLIISFGSFTRMDYGTGHEAAFSLLLLCLSLIRFFTPSPKEDRDLVLLVFYRYQRLCWYLQDEYRLEPAGSHGVWGLDDYSFISYIFGSAQLRDQDEVPVSAILRQPLPPTNLYFLSISRILKVKQGPFHEHSSQLYAIATGVPNWGKVHSGLFKMYEAEVLGKRVVVQHIPVGGLLEWDSVERSSRSATADSQGSYIQSAATRAPWADSSTLASLASNPSSLGTDGQWTNASPASHKRPSGASPSQFPTRAPWTTSNQALGRSAWRSVVDDSTAGKLKADQSDDPTHQ